MPWSRPRVPERQESVSADGWNDLGCTNSDGKYLVSAGVYDISACDVFDERLDLLYTPGKVYHRHNTLQLWKYWALVVLAIVLVRFLSYNVQSLWDPAKESDVHPQWPALACSLAVVAIVALDGDSLLVTSADQVFFWSTMGYVLVYLAIHVCRRVWLWQDDYEAPVYNVIVASLQLVASRFYAAAETPYNLVLIGILACRAWYIPPSRNILAILTVPYGTIRYGTVRYWKTSGGRREGEEEREKKTGEHTRAWLTPFAVPGASSSRRHTVSTGRRSCWTRSTYPCASSWRLTARKSC